MQFTTGPLFRHDIEATLAAKMTNDAFLKDIEPLIRPEVEYDAREAYDRVSAALIAPLPRIIVAAPTAQPATE